MKVTLANLLLCMPVLVGTGTSFPSYERRGGAGTENRVKYAAWDDVNVLSYGLLQLGQGLKEHVDKTNGQIRDISIKLKSINGTVAELGSQTQRLQEDSKALRAQALGLEQRESQVLNVSSELREKDDKLLRERQTVHERVNKLEEKVDGMLLQGAAQVAGNFSDAWIVLFMLEAQNKRIDDLVERIKLQQEKLDKQNVRIRTRQRQRNEQSFLKRKEDKMLQIWNGSIEQRDSPIVTPLVLSSPPLLPAPLPPTLEAASQLPLHGGPPAKAGIGAT